MCARSSALPRRAAHLPTQHVRLTSHAPTKSSRNALRARWPRFGQGFPILFFRLAPAASCMRLVNARTWLHPALEERRARKFRLPPPTTLVEPRISTNPSTSRPRLLLSASLHVTLNALFYTMLRPQNTIKTKIGTNIVLPPPFSRVCTPTERNKLCISGCCDSRPAPASRPKQPATRPIHVAHVLLRASEPKLAPERGNRAGLT